MKREALLLFIAIPLLVCRVNGSVPLQNSKNKEYELIVYVSNIEGEAIPGIVISTKGKGPQCKPTDGSGRTILKLQGEVIAGGEIDLVLPVDVKENEGWEIIPNFRPLIPNNPNAPMTLPLKRKFPYKEAEMPISPPNNTPGTPHNALGPSDTTPTDALKKAEDYQNAQMELLNLSIQLGHSEYNQKHYIEAFKAYRKALEIRPDYDEVLYYAALSLLQQKNYLEALPYIEKCVDVRNRKPESLDLAATYELYSVVLNALKRREEAKKQKAFADAIRARLPQFEENQQ